MNTFQKYYWLTKPGIIYGNLINTAGAYLFASSAGVDIGLFAATLAAIGLIIASACVVNNYIDREIDTKMARTSWRAFAKGEISVRNALAYGTLLGLAGFTILAIFTNWLTFGLGLLAIFVYIVLYGITKRRTVRGTEVGSIAGAMPPVAGYTSVTGCLDTAAIIIFLIYVVWQMAHFYAIAIYRLNEYKAAGIPLMPIIYSINKTKLLILMYICAFMFLCILLSACTTAGATFAAVMTATALLWLRFGLKGFKTKHSDLWAKNMFHFSLIVVLVLAIMLALAPAFP